MASFLSASENSYKAVRTNLSNLYRAIPFHLILAQPTLTLSAQNIPFVAFKNVGYNQCDGCKERGIKGVLKSVYCYHKG